MKEEAALLLPLCSPSRSTPAPTPLRCVLSKLPWLYLAKAKLLEEDRMSDSWRVAMLPGASRDAWLMCGLPCGGGGEDAERAVSA